MEKNYQPLSQKNMMRLLVVLCVALALLGGYFHATRHTLQRRYDFLYNKYNKLLDDYAELAAGQSEQSETTEVKQPAQ